MSVRMCLMSPSGCRKHSSCIQMILKKAQTPRHLLKVVLTIAGISFIIIDWCLEAAAAGCIELLLLQEKPVRQVKQHEVALDDLSLSSVGQTVMELLRVHPCWFLSGQFDFTGVCCWSVPFLFSAVDFSHPSLALGRQLAALRKQTCGHGGDPPSLVPGQCPGEMFFWETSALLTDQNSFQKWWKSPPLS